MIVEFVDIILLSIGMDTKKEIGRRIRQARGVEPADCVLKNCRVIDVFCGEIVEADVAICGERIAGLGEYTGVLEVDCERAYLSPGFIEGHIHIESSMLTPGEFTKTVLAHGTTAVVCDPHEIANVAGLSGVRFMIAESEGQPCSVFVMAPSCVPATHFENSGAQLDADKLEELCRDNSVIGIAEMMNFPGVLFEDEEVLEKLLLAEKLNIPLDGHAPGLSGKDLQAYISTGVRSDHECVTAQEAREKLRAGMWLFIREGSTAKNLEALLPVVSVGNSHRCLMVTDDCHPHDLIVKGHLDRTVRKAVRLGLDPVTAIQMVTINPANCFHLRNRGAVAAGYRADLVLFDSLKDIRPRMVFAGGKRMDGGAEKEKEGQALSQNAFPEVFNSVHVDFSRISFAIPARGKVARVIGVQHENLLTELLELEVKIEDGLAVADCENDIVKLAVIERHRSTGSMGLGFVRGFGIQKGALASTVGHDSHNITAVGVSDTDMELAVRTIAGSGGGLAVAAEGKVLSFLPLRAGGIMSMERAEDVAGGFAAALKAAKSLGGNVSDPFMLMSFLALPVIPHLKMTDLGLFDVDLFEHVELWVR